MTTSASRLAVPSEVIRLNDTAAEYPQSKCAHHLFEEQVSRTPDKIAVRFDESSISYRELNRRANVLARELQQRGVGPDALVALCVDRSIDMVVAMLAVLKAGGAYVPLDPSYPHERLAYIISDSGTRYLLTQRHLVSGLPESNAEIIVIEPSATGSADDTNPTAPITSRHLAYVIYTSGSTGKPKGVTVEHRSLVNLLHSYFKYPGIHADDIFLAVSTLSFDIAELEIYFPLTSGATTVIVSREEASDGKRLMERLASSRATIMQATPATWRLLMQAGWNGNPKLSIFCGGEAMSRDLALELRSRCGTLWNMYGPTETTIYSSLHRVDGTETLIPIGIPVANTQIYVLTPEGRIANVGEDGEIHIAGDGLARGYHQRPDLTNERFVRNSYSADSQARMYKTGDLGRLSPKGVIEYLGRIDQQVKVRGFRIEPGEIEFHLNHHPAVKQSVVVALDDATGEKQLVGYIVPSGDRVPFDELRKELRTKLPAHMVPSIFVRLDAIPLTPNGKVDRRSLPAPSRDNSEMTSEYLAPRDELETQLVAIWEEVLGVKPIGVRDNIFELGLHSLTAAALFVRVEKMFGEALPPGPLFQAPTVEALAKLLRERQTARAYSSLVCIKAEGDKPPFFCIHGGAGTVYLFHELARRLDGYPVYGLQAQGLYGRVPPHTSVEQMAAHYLKEIREFYPEGPLLLGGWCYGGIVAYEMAQQARKQNERTDLVVLLAAPRKTAHLALAMPTERKTDSQALPPITSLTTKLGRHYAYLSHMNNRQRLDYIRRQGKEGFARRIHSLRVKLKHVMFRRLLRNRPIPERFRDSFFREMAYMAECRYVAQPYPGEVIVIKENHNFRDSYIGWGEYVNHNRTHLYSVNQGLGDHRALMREPAVSEVADILLRHLSAVETLAAD